MMSDGIYVNTESNTAWGGRCVQSVKDAVICRNTNVTEIIDHLLLVSKQTVEAENRRKRILIADYRKIDTDEHVDALSRLSDEQKEQLKRTLRE